MLHFNPEDKGSGMVEMDDQFFERVYARVGEIPYGTVCTYGTIAEMAGYPRASREVGYAMSRLTQSCDLPCHRVVNKTGILAPNYAFGGKDKQRKLLQDEGITFRNDGTIDMERHRWPPDSGPGQLSLGL